MGGVIYLPNLLAGEFRGQAGIPHCHLYVRVPLAVLQHRGTLTTHYVMNGKIIMNRNIAKTLKDTEPVAHPSYTLQF